MNLLSLILGVAMILLYIYFEISKRRNKVKYRFEIVSARIFWLKIVFVSAIIAYITWIIAGYNGFPGP